MRWVVLWGLAGCYHPSVVPGAGEDGGPGGDAGAGGTTYYVAASGGSDEASGTSRDAPWATFGKAFSVLGPGDTLVLLGGSYTEPLAVAVSGEDGKPITIRADADGDAVITGGGVAVPCSLIDVGYVSLEGIHCQGSVGETVRVADAHDVRLSRVTAAGIADSAAISVWRSQAVTVVDCAAWGPGPNQFEVSRSQAVSLLRCYGHSLASHSSVVEIYLLSNSSDCRIEGSVATSSDELSSAQGFQVWADFGESSERNTLAGDVAWRMGGWGFIVAAADSDIVATTTLVDVAAISTGGGLLQEADDLLTVTRLTVAGYGTGTGLDVRNNGAPHPSGYAVGTLVQDSVLFAGEVGFQVEAQAWISVAHHFNDLWQVTTHYAGGASVDVTDHTLDPGFDTTGYARGAYLRGSGLGLTGAMNGPVGAIVLEAPAGTRLWPWPMEERIRLTLGTSVTYEREGGLWTTLDGVY